jgi:hypothetical protein
VVLELWVFFNDSPHEVQFGDDQFGVVFHFVLMSYQLADGHADVQERYLR